MRLRLQDLAGGFKEYRRVPPYLVITGSGEHGKHRSSRLKPQTLPCSMCIRFHRNPFRHRVPDIGGRNAGRIVNGFFKRENKQHVIH